MTITAANLQTQAYQFQHQTVTGRWSWVTVMDVSGSVPSFRVERIISPFGIFRDSIPIPGDVVVAMSDSITQIRTQFPPAILIGPPSSLVFDVDEGRGFTLPQDVVLTNNGVFGSLLGTTLTSSAAYVTVSPAQIGNLSSNETGTFEVAVDSSGLISLNSPYMEMITIEDPMATNTPQMLPITINVRPKATVAVLTSTLTFNVIKPLSSAFPAIPSQTFLIENTGPVGSVLNWQIQKLGCEPWLAGYFPVSGTLASGATETITVSVAPPTSTMTGTFTETLRISGFSENQFVDVTIQLVVT